MPSKRDFLREVRLLERSYARGEISREELISQKRGILLERSRIPKRVIPKRKTEPKINLKNKNNGLIVLLILALSVFITFFFVSGGV